MSVPPEMWFVILAPPAWAAFVTTPLLLAASRRYRLVRVAAPAVRRPQPPVPVVAEQPVGAEAA